MAKRNRSDIEELIDNYLSGYRELGMDYSEHRDFLFADLVLLDRDEVQFAMDVDPGLFRHYELTRLKNADNYVLDNVETASEWVRNLVSEPDQPRSHWWWYLDLIADELMPAPDLDELYASLIEKAERKVARAF